MSCTGYTWSLYPAVYTIGVRFEGKTLRRHGIISPSAPDADRAADGEVTPSNAYNGDTSCDRKLPILCYNPTLVTTPPMSFWTYMAARRPNPWGRTALTMESDFSSALTRLTVHDYQGHCLFSATAGDDICETEFGTGWLMVNHQNPNQAGWRLKAFNDQNPQPSGAVRFWTVTLNQPGTFFWTNGADAGKCAPSPSAWLGEIDECSYRFQECGGDVCVDPDYRSAGSVLQCGNCFNDRLDAQNGEEGVDCSGPCPNVCASPSLCFNGQWDAGEVNIDCGGECNACADLCNDLLLNQGEQLIDCGGSSGCGPCPPSCFDGIQNQDESCIDGGGVCNPCPLPSTIYTTTSAGMTTVGWTSLFSSPDPAGVDATTVQPEGDVRIGPSSLFIGIGTGAGFAVVLLFLLGLLSCRRQHRGQPRFANSLELSASTSRQKMSTNVVGGGAAAAPGSSSSRSRSASRAGSRARTRRNSHRLSVSPIARSQHYGVVSSVQHSRITGYGVVQTAAPSSATGNYTAPPAPVNVYDTVDSETTTGTHPYSSIEPTDVPSIPYAEAPKDHWNQFQ